MRVISPKVLKEFYGDHPDAEGPIKAWLAAVNEARWKSFNDLKAQFAAASIVGNDRVVFNIKANKYRIVVKIEFRFQLIFVRFVGTHSNYDQIDASKI